jgi:hypothetical protein
MSSKLAKKIKRPAVHIFPFQMQKNTEYFADYYPLIVFFINRRYEVKL